MKIHKTALKLVAMLAMLLAMPAVLYAQTAAETLKKASGKITKASGVSFNFSATGQQPLSGSFKASGTRFAMTTKGGSVWYNGTYMWTYNPSSEETTRVQPTSQELAETNPLIFIAGNSQRFNAEWGKSDNKNHKVIILTPKGKDPSGVQRAVLTLNASTLTPVKIAVKINGQTTVVTVSNLKLGGVYPESTFVYPKAKYPGVPVVNL